MCQYVFMCVLKRQREKERERERERDPLMCRRPIPRHNYKVQRSNIGIFRGEIAEHVMWSGIKRKA